jgi:hypothetical protein
MAFGTLGEAVALGASDIMLTNSTGQDFSMGFDTTIPPVPIPAAVWLFGTALIGLVGIGKRRKTV